MNVLISSYTLDLSGVPTYTLTLYDELVRRGYKVQVYSPCSGYLETQMNTCTELDKLIHPDAIIAQHKICAIALRKTFPNVPMIFSAHGVEPDGEQPDGVQADWYTAINEETFSNLTSKGIDPDKITIVRDFIDIGKFDMFTQVNNKLSRVLFISNRKKWKTYDVISGACTQLGLKFSAAGAPYGRALNVSTTINENDLVIGSGRAILEGMACGRPVIVFDKGVGDGYLSREVYMNSRTHNFCGNMCMRTFNIDEFVVELQKYDRIDGLVNRDIILAEHNVEYGADQLLYLIRRLM